MCFCSIIEEIEERVTEAQIEQLLQLIRDTLPEPPPLVPLFCYVWCYYQDV